MEKKFLKNLQTIGIGSDEEVCFTPLVDIDADPSLFEGVKTRSEFYEAVSAYARSIALSHAENGVRFVSLDGIVIAPDARIGEGTTVYPNVQIKRGVKIGKNCVLTSGTVIEDSVIGDDCVVNATQIYSSVLDDHVKIGPFAHVRPNTRLRSGVKAGDFVEFKNSDVGEDTKISHLTYIGDANVGKRVNFGCGTVISNYDGIKKYRTVIGDDAFIGCNTNLIAPVTVEDGAFTAAGSTITDLVPSGSLAIARQRQVNIDGWVERRNRKKNE